MSVCYEIENKVGFKQKQRFLIPSLRDFAIMFLEEKVLHRLPLQNFRQVTTFDGQNQSVLKKQMSKPPAALYTVKPTKGCCTSKRWLLNLIYARLFLHFRFALNCLLENCVKKKRKKKTHKRNLVGVQDRSNVFCHWRIHGSGGPHLPLPPFEFFFDAFIPCFSIFTLFFKWMCHFSQLLALLLFAPLPDFALDAPSYVVNRFSFCFLMYYSLHQTFFVRKHLMIFSNEILFRDKKGFSLVAFFEFAFAIYHIYFKELSV